MLKSYHVVTNIDVQGLLGVALHFLCCAAFSLLECAEVVMSPGEQFGGRDFRQYLSESGKEIMVEGLRAFAQLINEQVGCPGSTSSASSDESYRSHGR